MTRPSSSVAPRRLLICALAVVVALVAAACAGATVAPPRAFDDPAATTAIGGAQPDSLQDYDTTPAEAFAATAQPVPAAESVAPPADEPACIPPALGTAAQPVRIHQAPPLAIGAAAAVVIDGDSGAVLWGQDEHLPLQPASITKIVTALIAIERGDLDRVINVDLEQRLLSRGSTMGLVTGDRFSLRDLLYGLMLPSGNDAAAVIAYHFAGGEREFAELMNRRLCQLGLVDSVFINPSGLGRGEYNLASAYDLAQVSRYAMQYAAFRELVGAPSWVARGSRTLWLRNLNELVANGYPGADGVKIGWTPSAGSTIVASATRGGHRVIVALMRTANRAAESAALLEWAFRTFTWPR